MDCFHEFCLNCDKQCADQIYCSQACRLADLEKANASNPSSPLTPVSGNHFTTTAWATSPKTYGPAFDAVSYQNSVATHRQGAHRTASGRLTPSSSRTSLASNTSAGPTSGLTEQARLELQDYFSSFDQIRAAKRRSSVR